MHIKLLFSSTIIIEWYFHISHFEECGARIFGATLHGELQLCHLAAVSLLTFHWWNYCLQSPIWNIQMSPLEHNAALVGKITSSDAFFFPTLKKNRILIVIAFVTQLYQCMDFFTVFYNQKTKNFGWIFALLKWIFCVSSSDSESSSFSYVTITQSCQHPVFW